MTWLLILMLIVGLVIWLAFCTSLERMQELRRRHDWEEHLESLGLVTDEMWADWDWHEDGPARHDERPHLRLLP